MSDLFEAAKWIGFRAVSRLTNVIGSKQQTAPKTYNHTVDGDYVWIFCSTIGELNACRPLLDHLNEHYGRLALITDRDCYQLSYRQVYPDAVVVELSGEYCSYKHLLDKIPPICLVVLEIPAVLHDAPCRLSYDLLRSVKKKRKPIYLVNGWLYGYSPASRLDVLEKTFFHKEFLNCFDKLGVQTENVRKALLNQGANIERIFVTGNMKFDSVVSEHPNLPDPVSREIVTTLSKARKRVFVAGCIVDSDEFFGILALILHLKSVYPDLFAVVAPRHPENGELMSRIESFLAESSLRYLYKSRLTSSKIDHTDLLVLDTIGELKGYFYCGDVVYMGKNHNILEPLAYLKPVFTLSGWEPSYPSYPVFEVAVEEKLIHCCDDFEDMKAQMARLLSEQTDAVTGQIPNRLEHMKGATIKNLAMLNL